MRERNSYTRIVQNVADWKKLEKGKIIQLLQHCVEHHITTFDTAEFDGMSFTGEIFGTALSESGLSRDEIQLVSKYNPRGESSLLKRLEQSLLDLDTDYLDLLLLDPSQKTDEIHEDIAQLFSQGKILELGGLNMNNSEMEKSDLIFHAKQLENPVNSFSDLKNIKTKVHPSEEISNFIFFELYKNDNIKAVDEMCEKYSITREQLLLAWIFKYPAQLHPVVKYTDKEQITAATSVKENFLAPIDWQKLNLLLS